MATTSDEDMTARNIPKSSCGHTLLCPRTGALRAFWLVAFFAPFVASALITSGSGNRPVTDPGWPDGALAVANLRSRVGWWEGPPFGGGQWQFLYRGDDKAFSEALTDFAVMRAPLELVIHDGPETNMFLTDADGGRVDWTFSVWQPASWNRLYNNPKSVWNAADPNFRRPLDAPRLDVYVGGGGHVDWAKVKVPVGITIRDERASAEKVDLGNGSMIQGEFFDMDTGKAISGAHLVVEKTWWTNQPDSHWELAPFADVESDAIGRATVEKIPADTIRVSVTAEGYVTRRLHQGAHARPVLLKFSSQLAKASSIRGTVTDSDGKPVEGVKVRAMSLIGADGFGYDTGFQYEPVEKFAVTTDGSGAFELPNLPKGYALLQATKPGYFFGDILTIHDVPGSNVVLRVTRAGAIQVSVVDKGGKALSQVGGNPLMVDVNPVDGQNINWGGGSTVKEGSCEFKDVPPGKYRITSRPNPSTTGKTYAAEQVITVQSGANATATITYE
jgi:hypothetical protein